LEIKSGELLRLLRQLGALYRLHWKQGQPQGRVELVRIGNQLAKLLELSEEDLSAFLAQNTTDAISTIRRVLRWLADNPATAEQLAANERQLPELSALVGLANLAVPCHLNLVTRTSSPISARLGEAANVEVLGHLNDPTYSLLVIYSIHSANPSRIRESPT